jgi:hypothetical protein
VTREALRRTVLASVLVALAATAGAEPVPVHPYRVAAGRRVRLWSASMGFDGTSAVVTASDAFGLTIVVKEKTELVPFDSIDRIDVRRGWRYIGRAALIGASVGAVVGVVEELKDRGDPQWEDAIRGAAVYSAVGAGVGTLTAGAIWPAKWLPVEIDALRPPIERPAARLSLTLRF